MTADVSSAGGLERRSALAAFADRLLAASNDEVHLSEMPFAAMVDVRLRSPRGGAADRLSESLGVTLPGAGEAAVAARRAVLWAGPDEWLVVAPDDDPATLTAGLEAALGTDLGSVVDVSAQRTTLVITGRRARDVLSKGVTLDLHARAFGPGRCAATTLARTHVVVWRVEDGYRLLVRSSFAAYLAEWLIDAATEFSESLPSALYSRL